MPDKPTTAPLILANQRGSEKLARPAYPNYLLTRTWGDTIGLLDVTIMQNDPLKERNEGLAEQVARKDEIKHLRSGLKISQEMQAKIEKCIRKIEKHITALVESACRNLSVRFKCVSTMQLTSGLRTEREAQRRFSYPSACVTKLQFIVQHVIFQQIFMRDLCPLGSTGSETR